MNKVLSIKGYRLYQMSFDDDRKGTFISVNHDRFGRPVSYFGFLLFGCSFLWFLFGKRSRFRTLLNDPLLKRAGLCLVLAALPVFSSASPSTVGKEQAIRFCELQVMYNNRVAPLQTLARDFTMKLTGKASHAEFTAEQVFVGWLLYPQEWRNEPMIRIKNKELRQILSINGYACYNDLFYKDGTSVLSSLWPEPFRVGPKNALMKTVTEVDEKTQLLVMVQNGSILTLFPHENKDGFRWLSPSGELPVTISGGDSLLIRHSLARLKEAVQKKDNAAFMEVIDTIESYQQAEGGVHLLSKQKVTAEWWYNVLNFSVWGYRFNLLVGLLSLVWFIGCLLKNNKGAIFFNRFLVVMLGGSFLFLSSGILLRTYVSGRFPLGNGYETMMFVAWCILLLTLFLRAKVPLMISFGFLFSGFALLVSSLGQMNPQITPLVPVLDSPWLSVHVSVLMMSYALLGFLMLNGLAVLLLNGVRKNMDEQIGQLTVLSRLLLYPAVFLLGIGIVFGAVWANESWGSYWSWDPKEVWALITFLVYCLPFHEQGLPAFRKPLFFHVYLIVAFGAVLMTYFGVNFVLGGMHGYN
jgi:cytochrome c-type biogenesis protein CcsB